MANLSNINNKFLVTTGGNVLIGQTSAVGSSIFQVTGNATFTGNVLIGTNINSSIGLQVNQSLGSGNAIGFFRNSAASGGNGLVVDVTNTPNNYIADFRIGNSSKVRIDSSGNVGIGIDTPTLVAGKIVHIHGTAAGIHLTDTASGTANTDGAYMAFDNPHLFIQNKEAGDIRFETNSTTRLTINSSGNVGINETNPAVPLHITRDSASGENIALLLDNNNTTAGNEIGILFRSMVGSTNTDFEIFGKANGANDMDLVFESDGSNERMRITSGGNVGINETNPGAKLTVNRSGVGEVIRFTDSVTDTGHLDIVSGGGVALWAGGFLSFGAGGGGSNTERMRITSGGNVGIGITPNVNSSVVNVIQLGKGMTLMGNVNDDRATMAANLYLDTGTAFRYVMDGLAGRFSIEDGQMVWGTAGSGTENTVATVGTKMTLLNNGNLGIGVTSPATNLDIQDATGSTDLRLRDSTGNTSLFLQSQNGINVISTITNHPLRFDTNDTERMRITSGGNVEISAGYVSSTAFQTNGHLRVVGNSTVNNDDVPLELLNDANGLRFLLSFSNTNGVVGSVSTAGSATSFNTSSDYRLKENVVEMTGALDRVSQLKPSRFNFIADADTTVDGFLAHEVQKIVPEAITGKKDAVDKDGNPVYQGIDQSKLVPLLVGAIQELKAEIELLKNK